MSTPTRTQAKAPIGFEAIGDGQAPETTPSARRRSRIIWAAAVVGFLLAAILLGALRPSRTATLLAPDNPNPTGAQAVAQVLREHGVTVRYVTTTAAALADARTDGTLLVTNADTLRPEQQEAIAGTPGDLALIGLGYGDLADLTSTVRVASGGAFEVRSAGCTDPHAEAAVEALVGGPQLVPEPGQDVQTCFAPSNGEEGGAYASWTQDGRTIRALADASPLTNAHLASNGNAALVLRMLGQHEHLTWYVPDPSDDYGIVDETVRTEPYSRALALQVILIGVAFCFWKGRRLGRVVTEPLPVVVRAAETTRGRGRLYRRSGAHSHAAAALRAGAANRIAGRIGLPATATREQVLDALARATGRSIEAVDSVLYGPAPTDDAGLIALTNALDTMESEVHRA